MSKLPGWLSKLCERAMRPDDGEWASASHAIARQAYDLDMDDDYAVDLLGLLIDECERLRAALGRIAAGDSLQWHERMEIAREALK